MRFCLMIEGNEGVTWEEWLTIAERCEGLGFDGLFRSDHLLSVFQPAARGATDAWTTIAAIAARTRRLRLGVLVSPVGFRHPSALARIVTTADHISAGRVELGLGAGWYPAEHRAHGFAFPDAPTRFAQLEEQLEIITGLFADSNGGGFTHEGKHYRLEDCSFLPKPIQRPHPPIILGGSAAPRGAELAARFANEFNSDQGSPAECSARFERVRAAMRAHGRDPASLTTSVMTGCVVGATEREYLTRLDQVAARMNTDGPTLRRSVEHSWVLGTPPEAVERLFAFREAGVDRVMLQHSLHDDIDTLGLLASDVFPHID